MNLRQGLAVLIGIAVSLACVMVLIILRPDLRAAERTYQLGQTTLWAAPIELLSFAVLLLTIPITIGATIALRDRLVDSVEDRNADRFQP